MSPLSRSDQVRNAIAQAVAAAQQAADAVAHRNDGPAPGDLYLFRDAAAPTSPPLEWAVLLVHPDDAGLFFVVPADDFPLTGPGDLTASPSPSRQRLTLRCGQGVWVPVDHFEPGLRVGVMPAETTAAARRTLGAMARSRLSSTLQQRETSNDREYRRWMRRVERARSLVEEAVEAPKPIVRLADFQASPPAALAAWWQQASAAEPSLALAAASGDPFLQKMRKTLAQSSADVRFLALPFAGTEGLTLMAQKEGVCAVWTANEGKPPALAWAPAPDQLQPAAWQPVSGAAVFRCVLIPWGKEGRIVLVVGDPPGKRVAIER